MSLVSDLYNALITRIQAELGDASDGYFRLGNPYKPEENSSLFMKQGYGVAIGSGENTNRMVNCSLSIGRTMTIVLTRQYFAKESQGDLKAETELALLEDLQLLLNNFEQDPSLNAQATYTRYIGDGGIEYVETTTDKFMMVRADILVEYFQRYT